MANNGDIVEHVGTNNSARDIDAIRQALGEDTISYFGFSYGSELGATWATMFPDTVRAAVFDGARDPDAEPTESDHAAVARFREHARDLPRRMQRQPACAFHNDGDAEGAFDDLDGRSRRDPIPSAPIAPTSTVASACSAIVQAMYTQRAVLAGARGSRSPTPAAATASGLLAFADTYFQRRPDGTFGNELEAFQAINCADTTERLDGRRGRRVVGGVHRGRAASRPGRFDRQLLVHVLPTGARSAHRDHRRRGRTDRGHRHDG